MFSNYKLLFLVLWALLIFLCIGIIFYFNRLLGLLISFVLKLVLWKFYNISITFQSFKLSFLVGSCVFKNLTIVTNDYTVSVLHGSLVWRYWLRNTRFSRYFFNSSTSYESELNEKLPSKYILKLNGLEVFYYNRSDLYNQILTDFSKNSNSNRNPSHDDNTDKENSDFDNDNDNRDHNTNNNHNDINDSNNNNENIDKTKQNIKLDKENSKYLSFILNFLPLSISINKGALIIGNNLTSSILISSFNDAIGSLDILSSLSQNDLYNQLLILNLNKFKITIKKNISYNSDNDTTANDNDNDNYKQNNNNKNTLLNNDLKLNFKKKKVKTKSFNKLFNYKYLWPSLPQYLHYDQFNQSTQSFQSSNNNDQSSLFQNSANDLSLLTKNVEYAIYSTLLDAQSIQFNYYYDIPKHSINAIASQLDTPPQFGIDLIISNSIINYGPWAERQRISLYNFFFPNQNNYKDLVYNNNANDNINIKREYQNFKININFIDKGSILRIPMKENSKDIELIKQYQKTQLNKKKHLNLNHFDIKRPFAWLELKFSAGSSIKINSDMILKPDGFNSNLICRLTDLELSTSLNHDIFLKCSEHNLNLTMNYPLKWNDTNKWTVNNTSRDIEIFLLRDHFTLLTDLLYDFTTNNTTPKEALNQYNLFRPYLYIFNWNLIGNSALYLNINEKNIINNPLDFDKNVYLSIKTDEDILIQLEVPTLSIYPKSTTIHFNLFSKLLNLNIEAPSWHTFNSFSKSNKAMKSYNFSVDGSYTYYSKVELDLVDSIIINCKGENVTFIAYGFSVKYIMTFIENYFGENIHFKTLEEYKNSFNDKDRKSFDANNQQKIINNLKFTPTLSKRKRKKIDEFQRTENEIDVLFSFCVDDGCLILPNHIYDSDSHMSLSLSNFDVDIRFTNYYMDLQCDISPINLKFMKNIKTKDLFEKNLGFKLQKKYDMFIDSINVHGHRLFGLPPDEPTYVCKWDIKNGAVIINSSGNFLNELINSFKKIAFGYDDIENSSLTSIPIVHDVTFFTYFCPLVSIKLSDDKDSGLVSLFLNKISVKFNDLANNKYSSRLDVKVDSISLEIKENKNDSLLYGGLTTSLELTNFGRKKNFISESVLQQQHLQKHDACFHRCPFFLATKNRDDFYLNSYHAIFPSLPIPDISWPLNSFTKNASSEHFLNENNTSKKPNNTKRLEKKENEYYFGESTVPNIIEQNSETETDSLIINFATTNSFLLPSSFEIVLDVLESFLSTSFDSILDNLQIDTVDELIEMLEKKSGIKFFRLLVSSFNFKYGEFKVSSVKELFTKESSHKIIESHISFKVTDISVSLKEKKVIVKESKNIMETQDETTVAANVKQIILNIYKNDIGESENIFTFLLNDIEAWYTNDSKVKNCSSFSLENFNILIKESQLYWLENFLIYLFEKTILSTRKFESVFSNQKKAEIELLYKLSTGNSEYPVQHDPAALTKPMFIFGLSKNHIRNSDSWRFITKLRHIFLNLPSQWHQRTLKVFDLCLWEAPKDSKEIVARFFSDWRSWEDFNIEESYIFKYVFEKSTKLKNIEEFSFRAYIKNFCIRLISDNMENNYILLNHINIQVSNPSFLLEGLNSLEIQPGAKPENFKINISVFSSSIKISPLCFSLIKAFKYISKSSIFQNESKTLVSSEKNNNKEIKNNSVIIAHALFFIENLELEILIDKTSYKCNSLDSSLALFLSLDFLQNKFSMVSNYTLKYFDFYILLNSSVLGFYSFEELLLDFVNESSSEKDMKKLDINLKTSYLLFEKNSDVYIEFADIFLNNELDIFKNLNLSDADNEMHQTETSDSSPNFFVENILNSNWIVSFQINQISWELDLFSSIDLNGSISRISSVFYFVNSLLILDFSLDDITNNFLYKNDNGENINLIYYFHNSFKFLTKTRCEFLISINKSIFDVNIFSGKSLLKVPDLPYILKLFFETQNDFEITFNKFSSFIKTISDLESENGNKTMSSDYKFKLSFISEIIRLSFLIEDCELFIELESIKSFWQNFIQESKADSKYDKDIFSIVPINGVFDLSSVHFSVNNSIISKMMSRIIDINFEFKLKNVKTENDFKQKIEAESQFARIYFNPFVLVKIFQSIDILSSIAEKYQNSLSHTSNFKNSTEDFDLSNPIETLFGLYSIHFFLHNVCFGWIFDENDSITAPKGIITGCSEAFINLEKNKGIFKTKYGFFGTSYGCYSDNFYCPPNKNIDEGQNRSFLPSIQVFYDVKTNINNSKDVEFTVYGEELDVKCSSEAIPGVLKSFLNSVVLTQDLSSKYRKRTLRVSSVKTESVDSSMWIQFLGLKSLKCLMTFAGGNINIVQSSFGLSSGSLNLHSPKVQILVEYNSKTLNSLQKLLLKFIIFDSDNTLNANSVPIIIDISSGIRCLMKQSRPVSENQTKKAEVNLTDKKSENNGINLIRILRDFDFQFSLHVKPQRISLSCEPTAKVKAIVSTNSLKIQFNTITKDQQTDMINGSILLSGISASLQHIYSRAISGSVQIKEILLNVALSDVDSVSISSANIFADNSYYVNIKQLEDIDMFLNIWFPKELYKSDSSNELAELKVEEPSDFIDQSLANRLHEVTTTYAFPWTINFLLINTTVKVDFGQSLGIASFNLDRFWFVSTKTKDWGQNMTLGFDNIFLVSKGRLSGSVLLEDIRLNSVISWREGSKIPLILISAGVEKIEVKIGFDYHCFFIANIQKLCGNIFNQRDKLGVSHDRLVGMGNCSVLNIYLTALSASNFLDIYSTFSRISEDNKTSYKDILDDENLNNDQSSTKSKKFADELLKSINRLKTELDVTLGKVLIHIYPSSLIDSQVLIYEASDAFAKYSQDEKNSEYNFLESKLELVINNFFLKLSSFKNQISKEVFNDLSVSNFVRHSEAATGGTIFIFPSLLISMVTVDQLSRSNVVYYSFNSSFGGKVDISWNLRSISFIREMWTTHSRAWSSRTSVKFVEENEEKDRKNKETESSEKEILVSSEMKNNILDESEISIEDVKLDSRYIYVPIKPLHIEAPQLKDLGDATPPLEWFGLYRKKFPLLTHQYVMIMMNKIVDEVEAKYASNLGKA
ncbi:Csf1p ASCRUDRAFT_41311 [Ascoidea rubescens DSM 1968]|uniref:Protein CSF1 n=1 Tax=Ascoidea rubescens DSM 1968 TaxID=1344418 RepID=A0A1D2VQ46_9ASCO|nr:hypothetical protein ASCRUDRAFT_41311 [Ascoidea rubescens DSM 1968]ODV63743.1 hypothetical protein ASCRUDRAFT_41311 [Ascoidea rubescens DSM 1968]